MPITLVEFSATDAVTSKYLTYLPRHHEMLERYRIHTDGFHGCADLACHQVTLISLYKPDHL